MLQQQVDLNVYEEKTDEQTNENVVECSKLTLDEALDLVGFGKFHIMLLFITGFALYEKKSSSVAFELTF